MSLPLQLISAKRAFDPRSLYAGGVNGVFLNPAVTSSVFQDTAAATPAVPTDPIGRINDQSGNGNHATQATGTKRPIYALGSGHYSIEYDATDDVLATAAAGGPTSAFTVVMAVRIDSGTGFILYNKSTGNSGFIIAPLSSQRVRLTCYQSAGAVVINTGFFAYTDGQPFILSAWYDGTNAHLQINSQTVLDSTALTLVAGSAALYIGAALASGSGPIDGGIYGLIYTKDYNVSAANREACKAYLAARAGVTL